MEFLLPKDGGAKGFRHFDKEDVRTYGLSFVVKTRPFSSMFGSVMVRQKDVKNPGRLKALERFEILYTADFNPNTSNLISFRKDVEKEYLGTYLVSLCKYFYERESQEKSPSNENVSHALNPVTAKKSAAIIHQCKHCFTIYDEALGDVENNVAAGTPFIDLPETYRCQLCEAGKEDFQPLDQNSLKQVGS